MAEFRIIGQPKLRFKEPTIEDNTVILNNKKTLRASFSMADVEVVSGDLNRKHISQRAVVNAPDGAEVLCYFKKGNEWHVVVVEQFRIAILKQTIEAPGGEVDEFSNPNHIRETMARELLEETRIVINSNDIQIVFKELALPSLLNGSLWGGIVEISESQLPSDAIAGEWGEGEYTVVTTRPLLELLRKRDSGKIKVDLWLSRLLDELAKRVGLLSKNY